MELVLNKHQIEPTYKLIYKCKEQHGLLLWYMMGTGKTISALTLIFNYPKKDVLIMCPKDLTFVWKNELKKIKLNNKITFLNYECDVTTQKLEKIKGKILILDEIQHLVTKLKIGNDISKKMSLLKGSCKTLALTGTPIYTQVTDLSYIINIVSGKSLVPINYTEFKYEYYKVVKTRSIIFGQIIPLISTLSSFTAAFFTLKGGVFQFNDIFLNNNSIIKRGIDFFSFPGERDLHFGFLKNALERNKKLKTVLTGVRYETIILASLFTLAISFKLFLLFANYKMDELRKLDTKKLVDKIKDYTLYYRVPDNTDLYPSQKRIYKVVDYSSWQLDAWIKLTQSYADTKFIKDLNIKENEDVEYYSKKLNMDVYKNNGILIGNLSSSKDEYSPKFHEILQTAKGKRAVFYSSFTNNGICKFREFLKSKNIKHLYLDSGISNDTKTAVLQEFKDTTTFLLLHPSYTEGITIAGAEQLHLIEPITLLSKKEQVISRVVRYMSHTHLPKNERHVVIYQWYCENKSFLSKINKFASSVKNWIKLAPEAFYTFNYTNFEQDLTPDSLVIKEEQINIENDKGLTKYLQEKNKTSINCCIKFPSRSQQATCNKVFSNCSLKN